MGRVGMWRGVKALWKRKDCGCVNARLPRAGKVRIHCDRHRGKPPKKGGGGLAHFEDGMVRRG
jgi:hypothetical protein